MQRILRSGAVLAVGAVSLVLSGLGLSSPASSAPAEQPTGDAQATVETTPVTHTGDAADDPAIWRHPTDPSLSLVIGNDKGGALDVYDLAGNRIQQFTGGFFGNVDVHAGFPAATGTIDIAA